MITDTAAQIGHSADPGRAHRFATEEIDSPDTYCSDTYYFAKHVFCCIEGRHAVLLDLKRDKYYCIPRARLDACGARLGEWPALQDDARANSSPPDHDAEMPLRSMLRQGVLTTRASERNPDAPTKCPLPTTSLSQVDGYASQSSYTFGHIRNFAVATTLASGFLRWRHLKNVVHAVAIRRTKHTGAGTSVDLDACRELVRIFQALRPLFPHKYLCLFDSLALLRFLARYGQFANWVFGVRMDPFNAHCWVQAGDVVLNNTVDEVRSYTPIMVV